MDTRDKILDFIKQQGPIIPVQLAKHLGLNILFASAHLSELTSSKTLKVSRVKVGGTPLYYLPEQSAMLDSFADNLNEKDKRAYDILKTIGVLRDSDLEPLMQVSLRNIKDYANALEVSYKGKNELFWKFHTLSSKETEEKIKVLLDPVAAKKDADDQKEAEINEIKNRGELNQKETQNSLENIEENIQKEGAAIKEEKEELSQISEKTQTPKKEKPYENKPGQKELSNEPAQIDAEKGSFLDDIKKYFNKKEIIIISHTMVRKTEHEFVIEVPSVAGNLRYFCKAKDKKIINDGDLSAAFIQSQSLKLPIIFLTKGKLTKKADLFREKEFKGMHILQI